MRNRAMTAIETVDPSPLRNARKSRKTLTHIVSVEQGCATISTLGIVEI